MIETVHCSDWRTHQKARLVSSSVNPYAVSRDPVFKLLRMMPEATDRHGAATRVVIFVSEPSFDPHNFQSPPARRPTHKPGANTNQGPPTAQLGVC